jgi:hypothetical protein
MTRSHWCVRCVLLRYLYGRVVHIDGIGAVNVYPVGVVRDVLKRQVRFWFSRSWRRRSYWNGWLAEPQSWVVGLSGIGRGWTPGLAVRSLRRRVDARAREARRED